MGKKEIKGEGNKKGELTSTTPEIHQDAEQDQDEGIYQRQLQFLNNKGRERLEAKIKAIQGEIEEKFSSLYDEVDEVYLSAKDIQQQKRPNYGRKVFEMRPSLLTEMFEQESYQTMFNIGISVLVMWGLSTHIGDFYATGQIADFSLIRWNFEGLPSFFLLWLLMFLSSFVILPLAHIAAVYPTGIIRKIIFIIYGVFQLALFAYSGISVSLCHFRTALALSLLAEQSRFTMKIHSYFREKIMWKTMKNAYAPVSPITRKYLFTEFQSFFYFLWAPTLLYRSKYPRTQKIRWSFVINRLFEVIGIFYYCFLLFRVITPEFQRTVENPGNIYTFTLSIFRCMGPGMALMFFAHFLLLHAWQNLFAELTCFGDRQFYHDWWNSRSWDQFYRRWNTVVHDFIHSFIYMDLVEFVNSSKTVAMISAFGISAIVHEYIVTFALGFFFPILFILFGGPGVLFVILTRKKKNRFWNVFMWLMLGIGNALLLVLYCREFYARQAHIYSEDVVPLPKWTHYLMPYSWRPLFL